MGLFESDTVEFKSEYVEDIRKEVIAFANTNGGTLYIGIADDGTAIGISDIDEIILKVSNSIRDSIKPDITLFVKYERATIDGIEVLAIRVQRGTARPYYLASKGLKSSGVYVRQGTSSVPASDAAIRQMIKESDGDVFEEMRSMNQELTFNVAESEFIKHNCEFGTAQMRTLGLINSEGMYTNLALLLSDQCPHIIKAATFIGSEQEQFHDRKEFTGSLFKQLNDAYSYLELRNNTQATFEGLYRKDSKDYSDAALREALLNAIVHREYSATASTLISVYDNRIEFVSYGGLAGNVTMEDVLQGLSVCRNSKLANVFYRLELIEAYGTGLRRISDAYQGKNATAEFIAGPNSFRVVLPNINAISSKAGDTPDISASISVPSNTLDLDAVEFITKIGVASRHDVEQELEISTSTAIRLMRRLLDEGVIQSHGKGKNTKYTVK